MSKPLFKVGGRILYCGKEWTIGAVSWIGERYYYLVRDGDVTDVSLVPASTLEEQGKEIQ